MNFIESVIEEEMVSRDSLTALTLSFFITSVAAGYYIHYLYKKVSDHSDHLDELDKEFHETSSLIETQADTLTDHDQRIRLKKDFDEEDELEDGIYQAWIGSSKSVPLGLTIRIWREKISTKKKNLEWKSWDETPDGSCVVRDFYLGNSNPDFSWKVKPILEETHVSAAMEDTLINGWDSICKIEIFILGEEKVILQFVNQEKFEGSKTCNMVLKKCIDDGAILWSRELIYSN